MMFALLRIEAGNVSINLKGPFGDAERAFRLEVMRMPSYKSR